MVHAHLRPWLDTDEVSRADCVEIFERGAISGDQRVLAIVQRIPCGRVNKGACAAARRGLLLKKNCGDSAEGEGQGDGETTQAAADDHDRFHRARPARPGFPPARRHLANQEYFRQWLSQYRKAIRSLRARESEIRRSNTLYADRSI